MNILDLASANLLSPLPLCFVLGAAAVFLRGNLKLPGAAFDTLSIYLMLAIGLRGGAELSEARLSAFVWPAMAALGIGMAIPLWCFALLRRRFGVADAAALAAHYGSVSAVTFAAALTYLDTIGQKPESFISGLLALMEAPAIVVALMLARAAAPERGGFGRAIREILGGKSVLLLLGGLAIGGVGGQGAYMKIRPFFGDLYQGALCLFMLELGSLAAGRAADLRKAGLALIGFGIVMPIAHGLLGAWLGHLAGLSAGGSAVLATLAASASYIAAPAAVRVALPQANPALYLTASLAVTFPFNLTLGLPLYAAIAQWIART